MNNLGDVMKRLALAVASVALVFVPVSANAKPAPPSCETFVALFNLPVDICGSGASANRIDWD